MSHNWQVKYSHQYCKRSEKHHPLLVDSDGNSLPFSGDSNGNLIIVTQPAFTGKKLWDAEAIDVDDFSDYVDVSKHKDYCLFGNSDVLMKFKVHVSDDNVNYYDSGIVICVDGDFYMEEQISAKYIKLKSQTAGTVTVNVNAKS